MSEYDIFILGSGPAGLSSGIYTSRAKFKTLVIDLLSVPAQIILTDLIENYPGFPEGINGFELMSRFKLQAEKFGCEILSTSIVPEILEFDSLKKIFKVSVDNNIYNTKTIVIATGRSWKPLGVENETKFVGKGISYCGVCDAAFFKDKVVCVIGGGDSALQEALYISKFVKKLYLIHRRKEFRAVKVLQERIFNCSNIEIVTPSIVKRILGDEKVTGVEIEFVDTNVTKTLKCDGIFIFVGEKPNTEFLKKNDFSKQILSDENGYVITNANMETNIEGIFACGDCRNNNIKQIVTSCAEGVIAAESVRRFLEKL
ncbi:MAG: thioredoxin-disulfide reductase [Endomicrobiia bacterium]